VVSSEMGCVVRYVKSGRQQPVTRDWAPAIWSRIIARSALDIVRDSIVAYLAVRTGNVRFGGMQRDPRVRCVLGPASRPQNVPRKV
jgi:hypothetical protein